MMPAISDQDMTAMMAEESRVCSRILFTMAKDKTFFNEKWWYFLL